VEFGRISVRIWESAKQVRRLAFFPSCKHYSTAEICMYSAGSAPGLFYMEK